MALAVHRNAILAADHDLSIDQAGAASESRDGGVDSG
jgi:hypothetical protein